MAIFIGSNNDGMISYVNEPDVEKTLFANDSELSAAQVSDIVIETLDDNGIEIDTDTFTINKTLYAYNGIDDSQDPRPVMLTTDDPIRGAGLIATNLAGSENQIWVSGRYGVEDALTTKIFVSK